MITGNALDTAGPMCRNHSVTSVTDVFSTKRPKIQTCNCIFIGMKRLMYRHQSSLAGQTLICCHQDSFQNLIMQFRW